MFPTVLSCLILGLLVTNLGILCESLDLFDLLNEPEYVTGKSYVYVGGTLELNCTLEDKWRIWTPQDISFYFSQPLNFGPDAPEPRCLDAQTRVVSSTVATLEVDDITVRDAGQYSCHVGSGSCTRENLVGFAPDVSVEYSPQNVTDLRCVVRDWTETMMCTWAHPVEYVNWDDITVTLNSAYRQSTMSGACPYLTETSCEWKDTYRPALYHWLEINVTNSKTMDKAQKIFKIETNESVQPAPVIDLDIKHLEREGCLELTWSHRKLHRSMKFRVRHKAKGDGQFAVLATVNGTTLSYEKCGYKPMTTHEFAVDCYPTGNYSGYWSEPRTKNITMPQTPPLLGPQIMAGSYVSDLCSNGKRNVTVFWNDVKEEAQNGIIITVSIRVRDSELPPWQTPNNHYNATMVLECQRLALQLFAHNEAGSSLVPSEIMIPPAQVAAV